MFIAATIIVIIDQLTKRLAVWRFAEPSGDHIGIIPGFFELCLVYNEGAAWGILQKQRLVLITISALMLCFLVWKRREFINDGRFQAIAAGILAGGIAGNLVDRVLTGKVIDFFHFYWKTYDNSFPVFNIADSAICVGMFLLFLSQLLLGKKAKEAKDEVKKNEEVKDAEEACK